jgi:hypothetical protein
MSEDMHDSNNVPFRITAQCAECKVIFDATSDGLRCPKCLSKRLSWATREDVQPPAGLQPQGSAYPELYDALKRFNQNVEEYIRAQQYPKPDFSSHDAEIAWCEALMKLEDTRP